MNDKNPQETVSSVARAIDILYYLSKNEMKSIRELSEELEISKTTLHRILQTLESKRMVIKDPPTEKYYLGYRVLELSSNLFSNNIITGYALEHMDKLSEATGDTVQLAVIEDGEIIVIATMEGNNHLRFFAQSGMRYPISYGNFGKVFLAFDEELNVEDYLSEIDDKEGFTESLEQVRKSGISIGVDTPVEGAIGLAVPIFNSEKKFIASLSLVGVKTEKKLLNLEELKEKTIYYGHQISEALR